MTAARALAARHPEYETWLALHEVATAAIDDRAWAAAVAEPSDAVPMIDGVTFRVEARAVTDLARALLRGTAARTPAEGDALTLLEAGIAEDDAALAPLAERLGSTPAILATAAALVVVPLLQACRAAWRARISEAWLDAACPVCGAWAAVVEARGLERRLRHRCGRCGADWAAEPVRCSFCDMRDHERLTTLVSDCAGERGRVEACGACRGYVKTITTLTACPPAEVALLDLETVHLDVAALEHGFERPPAKPRAFSLGVAPRSRAGRLAAALLGGRR